MENASAVFRDSRRKEKEQKRLVEKLYKEIGQLKVERYLSLKGRYFTY